MLLPAPTLRPPLWQPGGHAQTILPGAFRRVEGVAFVRERISTPDDDFLDLDWLCGGHTRLVILTHGLEGSTDSQYIRGAARLLHTHNWDVLAWNCRSCSGEMNRQFRLYHHGDITDITTVIQHAIATGRYSSIVLAGFSMGGNITMKYVGTQGRQIPAQVRGAVAFCAPADLETGSEALDRRDNWIYRTRFTNKLVAKLRIKDALYPGRIDLSKLALVRRWRDFDDHFSAPMTGFRDAGEFYAQASARFFVGGTQIPTLLSNAQNDPILSPLCSPVDLARNHPFFHVEMPTAGGHCGFMEQWQVYSWAERRLLAWAEEVTR
jgi:uncharacterized protein